MKLSAFTLSEVLITLGVIGIVSAMTMPTLIKKYNNYITAQRLKKAYNTLSNGIRMSEIDNGYMKYWESGANIADMREYYAKYFQPYFKGIRLCKNTTDCGYKNFDTTKWTGASWSVETNPERALFQLADGTVVFYPRNTGSAFVDYFYVDINGTQRPNKIGEDVFQFNRGTEKGIVPLGKALKIMQNGWVIKD